MTAAAISSDGQFVAFESYASNLVARDTNDVADVFVRNLVNGVTRRVSVGPGGRQGSHVSVSPAISANGRYVAFVSSAHHLVAAEDTNGALDVFVRDRVAETTRRASVATDGREADLDSYSPTISADGRYVAFASQASNLVVGDTNGSDDVFVRDLVARTTRRVSVGPGGRQADGDSDDVAMSADGRYVAFSSYASNLVATDTNGRIDVFVRDVMSGTTRRASVGHDGRRANRNSYSPAVSPDGRYVAFCSPASNLLAADTNNVEDVFMRDLTAGVTRRVSVGRGGREANRESHSPAISTGGRYVSFMSNASNLVAGDTNHADDVFVRDVVAGGTRRVSVGPAGEQANGRSFPAAISADGRYVAFSSEASNLVSGDTNRHVDVLVRIRHLR